MDNLTETTSLVNFNDRKRNIEKKSFLVKIAEVGNKTELYTAKLEDLAKAVISHQITGNQYNRGLGVLNKNRVDEIVKNFYVDGFGQVTLVDNGDSTYTVSDGHHRLAAISELCKGNQLDWDGDCLVSIEITSKRDGLKNYATKGSAVGHSLGNKLTDPRLGLGHMIKTFVQKTQFQPYRGIHIINRKIYPQLVSILYTMSTVSQDKDFDFQEMIRYSAKEVKKLANLLPEELEFKIPPSKEKKLVESINFVITIMQEFIRMNDIHKNSRRTAQLNGTAQGILNSATFLTWLIWDKYSERGTVTSVDPSYIAQKMGDKLSDVSIANALLSGKRFSEGGQKLFEIIRTRKKDVFNFS